jgi:hypothetical protein
MGLRRRYALLLHICVADVCWIERLTALQAADIIKAANGDLETNADDSDSTGTASPSPPGQRPNPITTPPPTPVNVNVVTMTTFVTVYV